MKRNQDKEDEMQNQNPVNESQELATAPSESPRPALDSEMYAVALCVEGLEPLKDNPRSLRRVIEFVGTRYIDNMKADLERLDAEIKVVNERIARQKYETDEDVMVEVLNEDDGVNFSGLWNSIEIQAAWRSGARVRKAQAASA